MERQKLEAASHHTHSLEQRAMACVAHLLSCAQFLHLHAVQSRQWCCPPQLHLPPSTDLRQSSTALPTSQPDEDSHSLVLGCVKVTIKANHHT